MSKDTLVSVKLLNIVSNSTSGIVQVGDRDHSYLYSQAISTERNINEYGTDEPYFEHYPLFTKPIPKLTSLLPKGKVEHNFLSKLLPLSKQLPTIEVDAIHIVSNSESSNIQLGNSRKLFSENREKAIQQYITPRKKKDANR